MGEVGTTVLFQVPVSGAGFPNASGFGVEGGGILAVWIFEYSRASAEEVALSTAEAFSSRTAESYEILEPQLLTIDGHPAAQVDATSTDYFGRYISMKYDDEIVVTVEQIGSQEQVQRATPIMLEMFTTLRPSGVPLPDSDVAVSPELTQSHTRQADQTSFSAPGNWLIEETESYTLLTAPNGVTVGISSEPVGSEGNIVMATIAIITESLTRQVPNIELDPVEEFEVNSRPAARVVGRDGELAFNFWVLNLGGEIVGHISVIGPPNAVREVEPTVFAIAETITSGQVSDHFVETGSLVFTESITSEDGAFTIDYAADWSALSIDNFIVLSTPDIDLTGDVTVMNSGEFIIIVQNNLEFLADQTGLEFPQISDAATIARLVAQHADESGNPQSTEKLTINGRSASLVYGPDGDVDSVLLIFQMDDGELGSLNARIASGEMDIWFNTFLAIASSLSPR
jgi:hypothetical protein